MNKGVILLAVGHPYYGDYAMQLCRSIKAVCPTAVVALAHGDGGGGHVNAKNNPFDFLIDIPHEYMYTNGMKDYLKTKTCLYDLSPFKESMFLDADMIWCPQKPIELLFEQFKDIKFTISNRGSIPIEEAKEGFIHWASPKVIMEKYGIKNGLLYNLASELIYWKKDKKVKALFDVAKDVFEKPLIEFKKFGHSMPDELAFEIAILKTKIYPHAGPFIPFYWEHSERRLLRVKEIYENYFAYSIGGNIVTKTCATIYNALASHYNKQFGVHGYFPAKDKKSFLSERRSI